MKVKVRKHKKSPYPREMRRRMIKAMALSRPNLYSAVQKALNGSTIEDIKNNVSSFEVPPVWSNNTILFIKR